MPSYIELNKNASVPASSDPNKVILSVNTSGQVTTTDSTGQTTPVGGGGGTGLVIPKPIPYSTGNSNNSHGFNQPLSSVGDGSGLPGAIIGPTWNDQILKLTYQATDLDFLNYNPKYFLFVYNKSKRYGKASTVGNINTRINNQKYGRYYSHPASYTGSYVDDGMGGWTANFTSTATYTNFSGNTDGGQYFKQGSTLRFTSSFSAFTTEWNTATGSGQPTLLNGFDPLRFYNFQDAVSTFQGQGKEFFPYRLDFATGSDSGYRLSTTTVKGFKKFIGYKTANGVETFAHPRVNLYCKFAIVVNDPTDPTKYIIGPMSDTIKIFPRSGYFEDDVDTGNSYKYYYSWTWKVV